MDRPTSEDLLKLLANCTKEGWDGDYYFCPACHKPKACGGTGWSPTSIEHDKDCWIKAILSKKGVTT